MTQPDGLHELYNAFPQQFRSIVLSTVTAEGRPYGSYAPFVMDDQKSIYVFVSGLSAHTANLKTNGYVSVLLIEDESKTEQIFARRRLTYDCDAQVVAREDERWDAIATRFANRFGNITEVLRGLSDFDIFCLKPRSGQFVVGFGAAYQITGKHLDQLDQATGAKQKG